MKKNLNDTENFYHSEAVKLINSFYEIAPIYVRNNKDGCLEYSKQCATVLCDKMIEEYTISSGGEAPGFDAFAKFKVSNWQKIKVEIENV